MGFDKVLDVAVDEPRFGRVRDDVRRQSLLSFGRSGAANGGQDSRCKPPSDSRHLLFPHMRFGPITDEDI